jgi:hypothetical protein
MLGIRFDSSVKQPQQIEEETLLGSPRNEPKHKIRRNWLGYAQNHLRHARPSDPPWPGAKPQRPPSPWLLVHLLPIMADDMGADFGIPRFQL